MELLEAPTLRQIAAGLRGSASLGASHTARGGLADLRDAGRAHGFAMATPDERTEPAPAVANRRPVLTLPTPSPGSRGIERLPADADRVL